MNLPTTTALSLRDPWALVPRWQTLDAYIPTAVNWLPCSPGRKSSLARRLRTICDMAAAGQLGTRTTAGGGGLAIPGPACNGDLIQEGNVGLMKAVSASTPEGVRLVSHAPTGSRPKSRFTS